MLRDRWFRIGLLGAVIGGLCCFTPLAVVLMGALGLAAYAVWIDVVAMPLFLAGVGIFVASFIRIRQHKL